jgi:hypothetical protein
MLYSEIIAFCSQIHTEHINTLCGQNVECRTYHAVNTLLLGYKDQPFNAVHRNNRCLFPDPHKHINTLCGQNVECRTYRSVNTLRLGYKNYSALHKEIIDFFRTVTQNLYLHRMGRM